MNDSQPILTKCREFVREQSEGDWSDERIEDDAVKLAVFVIEQITEALERFQEERMP